MYIISTWRRESSLLAHLAQLPPTCYMVRACPAHHLQPLGLKCIKRRHGLARLEQRSIHVVKPRNNGMSRLYSPVPEMAITPSAPLLYPFPALCCCPLSFKIDRRPKQRLFNLEMRRLCARDTHVISTRSYGSQFPGPSESAAPYTFSVR
jgi:hypothetical protein